METQDNQFNIDSPLCFDLVEDGRQIIAKVYWKDGDEHLEVARVRAHHQETFSGNAMFFTPIEGVEWHRWRVETLQEAWKLNREGLRRLDTFLIGQLWEVSGQYPKILAGEIRQKNGRFEFTVTKRGHYENGKIVEGEEETIEPDKVECPFIFILALLLSFFGICYIVYVAIQFIQALLM